MGQAAFVTGAASGIGLGTALALAGRGFDVALNGLPGDPTLDAAAARVQALGVRAVAVPMDMTALGEHDAALARAEDALGPLTTLVSNAGVGVLSRGDMLDVTEAAWDHCMAVNAKAMFFIAQAFARRLLARDRDPSLFHSIAIVSSTNARAVAETRAEYCASKAAASMVARSFAVRLGREGIAVYDIQPGVISTGMTAPVIEAYREKLADGLALIPRAGEPADVGGVIAALASGALPYTTGIPIPVDGGILVPRY